MNTNKYSNLLCKCRLTKMCYQIWTVILYIGSHNDSLPQRDYYHFGDNPLITLVLFIQLLCVLIHLPTSKVESVGYFPMLRLRHLVSDYI